MSRANSNRGDATSASRTEPLDEERTITSAPDQEEQAPTGVELSEAFKVASHQFMRWGQFWFSNQRLSIPRVMVLKTVAEHGLRMRDREGYLRMHDIAEELGVTPRNITTIVDGLEREGLLARRRDLTDRRAIRLELTPLGKEQIEEIDQMMNTISDQFFSPLSAEQRRQLLLILQTLSGERNLPDDASCPSDQELSGVKKRGWHAESSTNDQLPSGVQGHLQRFHEMHERHRQRQGH